MAQKQEKKKSKYHNCIVENINKGVSYKDAQKSCEGKSRKVISRVKGVLQGKWVNKPKKKPNK